MKKNNVDLEKSTVYVKIPLGVRLAAIIGIIVLISLGSVTLLNSYFIGSDVKITAENTNLSTNTRSAKTVEDKLNTVRSNVFQLLDLMSVVGSGRSATFSRQATAFFFERNPDIASINILSANSLPQKLGTDVNITNNSFFISNEIDTTVVNNFLIENRDKIERSCNGEIIAANASPFFNIPVLSLFFPYKENGRDQTCIITFSIESVAEILSSDSVNTTYMINDTDELLFHPQTDRVLMGESLKNSPLVIEMRKNNQNNDDARQIPYVDKDQNGKNQNYYGAYQKISFGDIAVITTVPLNSVLEGVKQTRRNNLFLTAVVFFLSIIVILIYARRGISSHLRKLTTAAE